MRASLHSVGPRLQARATRDWQTAERFVQARFATHHVPDFPCFDSAGAEFFQSAIVNARHYLEYGSGGSTMLAHRHVKTLVSVESDKRFLTAVAQRLQEQPAGAEVKLIHAAIGLTEQWGYPVFTTVTPRRVQRWRTYPQAPWSYFRARNLQPDLILVDGRFRVACALESLLQLTPESGCRILIDDYGERPYKIIEDFADLIEMLGRMAVFHPRSDMDRERCRQVLETHYGDYQ